MYPVRRLVLTLLRASFGTAKAPAEVGEIMFRCMPWDLDLFAEMNNGRQLTLYDLGRFDLTVRNGMLATMRKHKWGLVVAGSTIMYRKRIKAFQKIIMRTQVVGVDHKWIYVGQSMWVDGAPCSAVVLRTSFTNRDGLVPPTEILQYVGLDEWDAKMPSWMAHWIAGEAERPWPPQP